MMDRETRLYMEDRLKQIRPKLNGLLQEGFTLGDTAYLQELDRIGTLVDHCVVALNRDMTQQRLAV